MHVNSSLRAGPSTRRRPHATHVNSSLRAGATRHPGVWWRMAAIAVMVVSAACGKKGPPLAPFVRVPATVGNLSSQRVGNDLYVSFPVPSANVDGKQPADIAALEVYAVTATRPPATEEQREVATLVATLPVRPILPELPVAANGSAPPPIPLPPGVDRGSNAVVKETITPELLAPVELPVKEPVRDPGTVDDAEVVEPIGPLVAPPPTQLPRRHYFVIGVSPRGRKSDPSAPLSVPLETGSSAPGAPKVDYTETQLTVTWEPSPDARTSTIEPPPPPPKPSGNASSDTVKPSLPAPLTARSLGFNTEATRYHLFEATPTPGIEDPYAIAIPKPLTPQPLTATAFTMPGVVFGVERCFEVRPVDQIFGTPVIGPASPRTCVAPKDRFPPAAPKSLAAIAGAGAINLIWDANVEKDVAGYLVLRAESPGDTLQPITKEPVAAATFRDEAVRAGVRYVYAVVALDTAGNVSGESNRVEETAR